MNRGPAGTPGPRQKTEFNLLFTVDPGAGHRDLAGGFRHQRATGAWSRAAAGFWAENGEIQYSVEEITIAGNLKGMFSGLAAFGNDVDRNGNLRTGPILIEPMTFGS